MRQCAYIDRPGITSSEREHFSKVYGINRTSALCEVPYFDVTCQLPQDIMHVLLEGLIPVNIGLLLTHAIESLKIVTLADINARIKSYPYVYFENKPSMLTATNFDVGGRQTGRCSNAGVGSYVVGCIYTYIFYYAASQMWELFHILPLLIGEDIPHEDQHYYCFMQLQTIATLIFSPSVAVDQIPFLRLEIQQYLENFKAVYTHYTLPPKSHYLVHIPTLMER